MGQDNRELSGARQQGEEGSAWVTACGPSEGLAEAEAFLGGNTHICPVLHAIP